MNPEEFFLVLGKSRRMCWPILLLHTPHRCILDHQHCADVGGCTWALICRSNFNKPSILLQYLRPPTIAIGDVALPTNGSTVSKINVNY